MKFSRRDFVRGGVSAFSRNIHRCGIKLRDTPLSGLNKSILMASSFLIGCLSPCELCALAKSERVAPPTDEERDPDFSHHEKAALPLISAEGKDVRLIAGSLYLAGEVLDLVAAGGEVPRSLPS